MGRAPTAAKAIRKKNDRAPQKTAAARRLLRRVLRLSAGEPEGRAWGFAPAAPLTDGVGSVLDWEVDFPLAGYAGPGFHTWPSGQIPQATAPKPLFRIRPPAKKTFGEAFGAATVAGYAGPGFHTWPSGQIPQATAPKPLLRIRSTAKKTFGEAFGAATGVSDPRLQKIRIRNDYAGKFTSRRGLGHYFAKYS
jgi:hypothetical protein